MAILQRELEDLRARLRALEKRNRWLQRSAALTLILAGAGLLMGGQAPAPSQVLEGERFSLRDATGKERAWLGMEHGEPVFRFLGAKGENRACLTLADQGMVLRVLDGRGRLQTGLSLADRGVALVTFDKAGQSIVGQNALTDQIDTIVPVRGRGRNR